MSANASSKSLKLTSVFLAVWLTLSLATEIPMNPGVIVRHSDEYLKLLHEKLFCDDILKEKLNNMSLPDLAGNVSTVFWSKINYNLTDIALIDYEKPNVELSLEPHNNVTLNLFVPKLKFEGKHVLELELEPWKLYKGIGNFSVSIIGAILIRHLEVVVSKEDKEKVIYACHNCQAFIKDVYLEFSDQLSENLGSRADSNHLRQLIGEYLCKASKYFTEFEIDFTQDRTRDFYLDMTILNQPIVRDSCVEYHHRGEMRHKTDAMPYKYWPEPVPSQDSEKMITCGISNWSLNSMSRLIYDHKLFNSKYTKDDLKDDLKYLLDTTCVGDCFGNLFPNVSKRYPNTSVEVTVSMVKEPRVVVDSDMVKSDLNFNIKTSVRITEYSSELLFSVNLDLATNVFGIVKGRNILFEFETPRNFNFTVLDSRIGHLPKEHLITVTAQAFEEKVIPFFTMFQKDGIKITSASNLVISDYKWVITEEAVWLLMNLKK